jgi:FkbM family methyltransferase
MIDLSHTKLFWYLKRKFRKANIRKGSPSQYGQDQVVYELLGRPEKGTFVDIGANDGMSFSNSLFFEEKNWTGLCIEPHPTAFKALEETRSCHCLNACVLDSDTKVNFLVVEGPAHMLSGIASFMDAHHLNRIKLGIQESGGHEETIQIDAISPRTFLARYSITHIDYLSIDTEGCELEILKHFDLKEIEVKVIGVENGSRSPELFNYLNRAGYKLRSCVGCDEIYTKR